MTRDRDEEAAYRRLRRAELADRRRRALMPDDKHGASGYTEWGCRCRICKDGHAARIRRYNAKRRKRQ